MSTKSNRSHRQSAWLWSFVEFLTCFNAVILLINILVLLAIKPVIEVTEGVTFNAQYMAIVTWPTERECDVDVWVRNPLGDTVYFRQRDIDHMSIDRDDTGVASDSVAVGINAVKVTDNREYVTFRQMFEGYYTLNVHVYSCYNQDGTKVISGYAMDEPLVVNVELVDLNPKMVTVFKQDVTFTKAWEEKTVLNFAIDKESAFKYLDNSYNPLVQVAAP